MATREGPPALGRVLAVTDGAPCMAGGGPCEAGRLVFVDYDALGAELLDRLRPDLVLSSILTPRFDAFDLARLLAGAGYRGRYRALTPRLPAPDLVRAEIRLNCPALDFDLLVIARSGVRRRPI